QGEQERAMDLLTDSIECAQRCGYQHGEGRALTNLSQARALSGDGEGAADCLTREGNAAEAIEVLREALAFFEALPERWGLLRAASLLAEACGALGDW